MLKILIKISGEILDSSALSSFVEVIDTLSNQHQIGIVVGGGNIIRGRDYKDRYEVDKVGIYSTLMNGIILNSLLSNSVVCNSFDTAFIERKSLSDLEGKVVIFTGGVGLPYFSTDSAAIIRALEMKADIILKATKVDGVYDRDPKDEDAKRYDRVTFSEILSNQLEVIDLTAAALALGKGLKMVIFDGRDPDNIYDAIEAKIGTVVED